MVSRQQESQRYHKRQERKAKTVKFKTTYIHIRTMVETDKESWHLTRAGLEAHIVRMIECEFSDHHVRVEVNIRGTDAWLPYATRVHGYRSRWERDPATLKHIFKAGPDAPQADDPEVFEPLTAAEPTDEDWDIL